MANEVSRVREELVAEFWREHKASTFEIAQWTGLAEEEVCRIIEKLEQSENRQAKRVVT